MAGLKEIKSKITSVKKTRKVTRAMEAVSAVKMRKAQERALDARTYARSAMRILGQVSDVLEYKTHPLVKQVDKGDTVIVLVTSDKGLAGSLNSAVLKLAEKYVIQKDKDKGNIRWICIGKRGADWAERRGYNIIHSVNNISDSVTEADMCTVTEYIMRLQNEKDVRKVNIIYTNFKSTFEQDAVMRRVLPLSRKVLQDIVSGILPKKGKWSDIDKQKDSKIISDYAIEPSRSGLLDIILSKLINVIVYHTLLENKASEHSARMVAMKNATDKAGDVSVMLRRKFNKARQAAITSEISEITSSIEAMK